MCILYLQILIKFDKNCIFNTSLLQDPFSGMIQNDNIENFKMIKWPYSTDRNTTLSNSIYLIGNMDRVKRDLVTSIVKVSLKVSTMVDNEIHNTFV